MPYTTPKFQLRVPSPSTLSKNLGAELLDMGLRMEEVLSSFDYAGTDPGAVTSRVVALESWIKYGARSAATDAERSAIFPAPVQGNIIWRSDKKWIETYYTTFNAVTNPQGATPAGWYPTSGALPEASAQRSAVDRTVVSGAWTNYSTTNLWTSGVRIGFAPYVDGWLIPATGRYLVDAAVTATVTPLFGGVSIDPSSTGRSSLEIETTSGAIAFNLARLAVSGFVELTAGDKLYIKATGSTAGGKLSNALEAKDAGHFNLRYIGPKRG